MYDVKPVTTAHETACGPACLKMMLGFYGQDVDLETLIRECGTKITGSTAKDLMVAGRKYGLEMRAFKMDAEEICKQDRPAIILWKLVHFCVFCGVDNEDNVWICNPDSGRFSMPKSTFERFFSKFCLFNGDPDEMFSDDYFGENPEEPDYFND